MSDTPDFPTLQKQIQAALLSQTRAVASLCAEDLAFHRSLDSNLASTIDAQQSTLLSLASQLLRNAADGTDVEPPRLTDIESLEDSWRSVVDVLDGLLERADTCLDEFKGLKKRGEESAQSLIAVTTAPVPVSRPGKVPRNLDISKPQKEFEFVPKNVEKGPFKPLLTRKPFGKRSLEESLELSEKNTQTDEPEYCHPYKKEIGAYSYPNSVRTIADPKPYLPFDTTKATYVDTEEALEGMLQELKKAKEIAIDLEHHDYRTYIGLVCLMQISTRDRDWVVDTLKPWRRRLECLNEVFADPSILKVFHGAQSDIIWLQRDLGLYIVGLFDTYHASRALRYQSASLAFLLLKFVNFEAQKQYQMADWRARPIPPIMFDYARSDTHFLLYIYDNMRNELIATSSPQLRGGDLIEQVLINSNETSLQRYEHPIYDYALGLGQNGWYRLLGKTPGVFSKAQFAVFRAVHAWRDEIARAEDESINYVLQNHTLFGVAREMPTDKASMFRTVAPVSPILRLRVDGLLGVIARAKAKSDNDPDMAQIMTESDKVLKARRRIQDESRTFAATFTSVGQIAQSITSPSQTDHKSTPIPQPDQPAAPLSTSQFWGLIPISLKHPTQGPTINLTLPLPDLTAEIFSTLETPETPVTAPTFVPADSRIDNDGTDDVFVVKSLGGKRKRGADRLDGVDLAAMNDSQVDAKAAQKAARKAARKEAWKPRTDAEKDDLAVRDRQNGSASGHANGDDVEEGEGAEEEEYEPEFDYAAAPSVLAAGSVDEQVRKIKGKRKTFDMYAKGLDAPKNLGRAYKGAGGKSHTFKK